MFENSCDVPYLPVYLTGKQAMAEDIFLIVDKEFYPWITQWAWSGITSKPGERRAIKWYGKRAIRLGGRNGRAMSLWLHKEICLRAHGLPPSASHIVADHINGNSLDCRADNLRWATPSENRRNYAGVFALQLRLDLGQNNGGLRVKKASTQKGRAKAPAGGVDHQRVVRRGSRDQVRKDRAREELAGYVQPFLGEENQPGYADTQAHGVSTDACPF